MIKLFKVSIKFNRILGNRGGRFLSIYDKTGKKINGKVLTNAFLMVKFQHAKTGKTQWVRNWNMQLVVADHVVHF
jgi:nitrous oxidase accessory protein NosD